MLNEKLKNICRLLLDSENEPEEIAAARTLSVFFTENSSFAGNGQDDSGEITLDGGVALSTYHAAVCVNESIRTARLIKGVHRAVCELQQRFPDQQLHIVYAGCGPYATLLFPLLPLFDPGKLTCTLLEINPLSIQYARTLAGTLGFGEHQLSFLEEDAIRYKSPETIHLLISETMFNALLREPQLRIVANLAPQLHGKGLMVPEEIRVDLYYSAMSREPYFDNQKDNCDTKTSAAEYAGTLFSLTRDNNFSKAVSEGNFHFISESFDFPEHLAAEKPDICIFTHIRTFGGLSIGLGESSLTNPYCVGNYHILGNKNFRLIHHFDTIPKWELRL
ncbi:MAG: hypothetical protein ACO1O6_01380 [Bacteroidota bacterium]